MKPVLHAISNDIHLIHEWTVLFKSVDIALTDYESISLFFSQLNEESSGVILLDVNSERMPVLDFLMRLKTWPCLMPVIIMTHLNDIKLAIETMKVGLKDFILKPYNEQLLIESVQKNMRNGFMNWEVNYKINTLSDREKEILFLILEGKLNRLIASELKLSVSTVEAHRRNIMKKLKVSNKAQLIRICLESERFKIENFNTGHEVGQIKIF